MSVTMTKGEGVTLFTVKSNPKSSWPPICQILGALCYSPICCSVTEHLRRIQSTSQSALGAMQIMVGLLNIGLGAILLTSKVGSSVAMDMSGYPFWLGALFIVFGIMCILSEKFPSPCLVIINVIFNLTGVGFAITAIVLYSGNLTMISQRVYWLCREYEYRATPTPTQSDELRAMMEMCFEGKKTIVMLIRSINIVLIVVSVLQLCLVLSSAVLGCKALRKNTKEVSKSFDDQENYKPLLEEVTTDPKA